MGNHCNSQISVHLVDNPHVQHIMLLPLDVQSYKSYVSFALFFKSTSHAVQK